MLTESGIGKLIKNRRRMETGSRLIRLCGGWFVISVALILLGALVKGIEGLGNVAGLAHDVGLIGLTAAAIGSLIAVPIRLVAARRYEEAKKWSGIKSKEGRDRLVELTLEYIRNNKGEKGLDAAILLIEDVANERVFGVLVNLLEDQTYGDQVRRAAAKGLGRSADERAVEPLITALESDKAASVRRAAVSALGETGDLDAVEPLVNALESDKDVGVRQQAANALGETRDRRAVEPLTRALEDEDLRQTARVALMRMPDGVQGPPSEAERLEAPCTVSITRPRSVLGAIVDVRVLLNGAEIGTLGNGETLDFTTEHSINELTVKYDADNTTSSITFDAEPGGSVHITLKYSGARLTID